MSSEESEQLAAIRELPGKPRIPMEFDPFGLYAIVSMVQLAQRHPEFPASLVNFAEEFVAVAKHKLAPDGGPLADAIERGNDPMQDEPM